MERSDYLMLSGGYKQSWGNSGVLEDFVPIDLELEIN